MYFLLSKFRNLVWKICRYNNKALFWFSVILDIVLFNAIIYAFFYDMRIGLAALNIVILSMAYLFFKDFDQNKIAYAIYSLRRNTVFNNYEEDIDEDENDDDDDDDDLFTNWLIKNDIIKTQEELRSEGDIIMKEAKEESRIWKTLDSN